MTNYKFKVDARNDQGYSPISSEITIFTTGLADPPGSATTSDDGLYGTQIYVSWDVPFDHGTPFYSYKILFRGSDGVTFYSELVNCDGMEAAIFAARACTVPVATLLGAPYNLPWGSEIIANIHAVNAYGDSRPGVASGAQIFMLPDPPEFS